MDSKEVFQSLSDRLVLWQKKYLSRIKLLSDETQLIYIIAMDAIAALSTIDRDANILATDGKTYTITERERSLAKTMHEMWEDYTDHIEENSMRLAQYRDAIRREVCDKLLKAVESVPYSDKKREGASSYDDAIDACCGAVNSEIAAILSKEADNV